VSYRSQENVGAGRTVTFETKCYERDWEYVVRTGRLQKAIRMCRYPFDRITLYVNNVRDPKKVARYAEKLVVSGVISEFVHVFDFADQVLEAFGCDPGTFKGGYYYSISEMVGIYRCTTDYLLHFSSDSMMENKEEWIGSAIERMEHDRRILVANPTWNRKFHEAKEDSDREDETFFIGNGFSDQCYLIPAARFRSPIYGEREQAFGRNYPRYGGESFEKRVDAYMRNHGFLRITSKKASYRHRNYPRSKLSKKVAIYLFLARSILSFRNRSPEVRCP
jgi:hypothetical protein